MHCSTSARSMRRNAASGLDIELFRRLFTKVVLEDMAADPIKAIAKGVKDAYGRKAGHEQLLWLLEDAKTEPDLHDTIARTLQVF